MSRAGTCTLKLRYDGTLGEISFPENTQYEDFIKIAMELFQISTESCDFVKITSGEQYVFTKEAFENYLMLIPEPDIVLKIIIVKDSMEDVGLRRWQQMCTGPKTAREPKPKKPRFDYF